jgi:lactate dehydrogenase-like 2-hydroxyacid dehydrogenase
MKKKFNILIDRLSEREANLEKKIFGKDFNVTAVQTNDLSSINKTKLDKIDGILAWHEVNYNKEVLSLLSNCKIIVRVGVGFDNVDLNFAKKKGITVCNIPDYGVNDVADYAITLLLYLIKKVPQYAENLRDNNIWAWGNLNKIKRNSGLKLGILGFGRIGSATALRAKSFGMEVIFYDPYLPVGIEKSHNVKRSHDLDSFLSNLDALSIHTPLNKETNQLIDAKFINKLKKGCVIINTARGGIVNTNDIYKAIKRSHIDSFGTDVLETEPPNKNNKLFHAWQNKESWIKDRVIITPHYAPFNKASFIELRSKSVLELKNFLINKTTLNKII